MLVIISSFNPCLFRDQRNTVYQADPETKVLLYILYLNTPLDKLHIFSLLVVYDTAIIQNILDVLKIMLVYFEPMPTVAKYCCIIVPYSLHHSIIISCMYHLLQNTNSSNLSGRDYVPMLLLGPNNVLTVYSLIVGDNDVKS